MDSIKEKIVDATEIKFLKKNEDATKRYIISAKPEVDIRKEVFNVLTDENITVLELKKVENSLEDAFLNVINSRDEEEAKIAKERDEKLSKMTKKERKKAIKEEKEKEFNDEWNRDKEIVKKEKEESKREKAIKKEGKSNRT